MLNLTHQERRVVLLLIAIALFGIGVNHLQKRYPQVISTIEDHRMIDLNCASLRELISVPGIGKKTAERIIEYRRRNGRFDQLKQLKKIKGINTSRYALIKEYFLIE